MEINSLALVYFSPTKTTKKVLEAISRGIDSINPELIDLTPPEMVNGHKRYIDVDLAVIGVPVYGGRVPPDAMERLGLIKAEGTPAAVVVVYGNRAYDDALLELKNFADEIGFIPIAAGAFIGEHSFSTSKRPIAPERPDEQDIERALEFGGMIRKKLSEIHDTGDSIYLNVPGNFPYKEAHKRKRETPVSKTHLCEMCGICASVCPKGAIEIRESVITDPALCIYCCACVKNCPNEARLMEDEKMSRITEWLYENHSARKEPEVFLD